MRFLVILSSLLAANLAFAISETTTCTNGKTTRTVEIQSEGQDTTKGACKVVYTKEADATGTVAPKDLWNAKNDVTFCQQKRDGFVQKLTGMGWTCTGGNATTSTTAAAPAATAPATTPAATTPTEAAPAGTATK